jgi:hypothetical protein
LPEGVLFGLVVYHSLNQAPHDEHHGEMQQQGAEPNPAPMLPRVLPERCASRTKERDEAACPQYPCPDQMWQQYHRAALADRCEVLVEFSLTWLPWRIGYNAPHHRGQGRLPSSGQPGSSS